MTPNARNLILPHFPDTGFDPPAVRRVRVACTRLRTGCERDCSRFRCRRTGHAWPLLVLPIGADGRARPSRYGRSIPSAHCRSCTPCGPWMPWRRSQSGAAGRSRRPVGCRAPGGQQARARVVATARPSAARTTPARLARGRASPSRRSCASQDQGRRPDTATPSPVGMQVTSLSQTRFGAAARKFCSSRLGATGSRWRLSVVVGRNRRPATARMPCRRNTRATRPRLYRRPSARSAACMRGSLGRDACLGTLPSESALELRDDAEHLQQLVSKESASERKCTPLAGWPTVSSTRWNGEDKAVEARNNQRAPFP